MANRQIGSGVEQGVTALGHSLSGAVSATVLTYVCPPGRNAMVRFASVVNGTGAPGVALQVTVGGTTVSVFQGTAGFQLNVGIALNSADTATLFVFGPVAASTFDGLISVEERSNA